MTQDILDARHERVQPNRFAPEPKVPTAFGDLPVIAEPTPGPWAVTESFGGNGELCYLEIAPMREVGEPYRGSVACCFQAEHIGGITWDEARANARVMAAAKDMLTALRMAEGCCLGDPRAMHAVRSAIALATFA